jgi:hypothetical protein
LLRRLLLLLLLLSPPLLPPPPLLVLVLLVGGTANAAELITANMATPAAMPCANMRQRPLPFAPPGGVLRVSMQAAHSRAAASGAAGAGGWLVDWGREGRQLKWEGGVLSLLLAARTSAAFCRG